MKQYIVGFGGRAESGKTTAAEMLTELAAPETREHIEFSDAILVISQAWLNKVKTEELESSNDHDAVLADLLPGAKLDGYDGVRLDQEYLERVFRNELDCTITPETKRSHRSLLEWLGMRGIQLVSPTIWGDMVHERIQNSSQRGIELITIGGVRSFADNLIVKRALGQTIRLYRAEANVAHLTDRQLRDWTADYEVNNNGTFDELRQKIHMVWNSISKKNKIAL